MSVKIRCRMGLVGVVVITACVLFVLTISLPVSVAEAQAEDAATAALIAVNAPQAEINFDGVCSLVEAIENANADAVVHVDCAAGNGADVIALQAGTVVTISTVHTNVVGAVGLPPITSDITISGSDATILRNPAGATPRFRLFYVTDGGKLVLQSVELRNGDVTSMGTLEINNAGGAILNHGAVEIHDSSLRFNQAGFGGAVMNGTGTATLLVDNGTFRDNVASFNGGAIYSRGFATISGSVVIENTATDGYGGGLFSDSTNMSITNSKIRSNQSGVSGGGIAGWSDSAGGTLSIRSSEVYSNQAQENGGGIANLSGGTFTALLLVDETDIYGNVAIESGPDGGFGGGVFNGLTPFPGGSSEARAEIQRSSIRDNQAQSGGGVASGTRLLTPTLSLYLLVDQSAIYDNRATGSVANTGNGGGLVNMNGAMQVVNSTVSGNAATTAELTNSGTGGGIANNSYAVSTTLEILNSTIANNQATVGGGGVANVVLFHPEQGTLLVPIPGSGDNTNLAVTRFGNALVATNQAATVPAADNCLNRGGRLISLGGNLEDTNSCGFTLPSDQTNVNARIGPLADNDGPTLTHILLTDSPALSRGIFAICAADPVDAVDQRGSPRTLGRCDVGAYEGGSLNFPIIGGLNGIARSQ